MWNRRQLLKSAGGTAAAAMLARPALSAANGDHFFLQMIATDGWDVSYLFDARPLSMTAAGKITNYLAEEPQPWIGKNGQTTLVTTLTDVLRPFQSELCVLNGVLMAPSFDGHGQNTNQLLTGNPFGGESFIPYLNQQGTPLDFVRTGFFFANTTNEGAGVPLDSYSASILAAKLRESGGIHADNPLQKFIKRRANRIAGGTGRFSAAAAKMEEAFGKAPHLSNLIKSINLDDDPDLSDAEKELRMISEFFKTGATTNAVMALRPAEGFLDMHSADDCANARQILGDITNQIAGVLRFLSTTPFDNTRSMLDVTTVMVTSEFSRTMRQDGFAIDDSGTDHNPLNNTVLLAGKGIKGDLVLGESDFRQADEALSAVHKGFDPNELKMMGKPFDFKTGKVHSRSKDVFQEADYLTINNVANTICELFAVPHEQQRTLGRNGDRCSVIDQILI